MGKDKSGPLRDRRYNRIKHRRVKKDLDEARQRAISKITSKHNENVPKDNLPNGKPQKNVSHYTKTVREFGERRREFDSKAYREIKQKSQTFLTNGRLTMPQRGIFMRSKMSSVATRPEDLNMWNQARINDDLFKLISLSNTDGNAEHRLPVSTQPVASSQRIPLKEIEATNCRQVEITYETDDHSEGVDEPPTPPFLNLSEIPIPNNKEELKKTSGKFSKAINRFKPRGMRTASQEQLHRAQPKLATLTKQNVKKHLEAMESLKKLKSLERNSQYEPVQTITIDESGSCLTSPIKRLKLDDRKQAKIDNFMPYLEKFAAEYISRVEEDSRKLTTAEGCSYYDGVKKELRELHLKTCAKKLRDRGQDVNDDNVHNLTLQMCGSQQGSATSKTPKVPQNRFHSTILATICGLTSLPTLSLRKGELVPNNNAAAESVPKTVQKQIKQISKYKVPSRGQPGVQRTCTSKQVDVRHERLREEKTGDVSCASDYSQSVSERSVVIMNPEEVIKKTLGSDAGNARRVSVFDQISSPKWVTDRQTRERPGHHRPNNTSVHHNSNITSAYSERIPVLPRLTAACYDLSRPRTRQNSDLPPNKRFCYGLGSNTPPPSSLESSLLARSSVSNRLYNDISSQRFRPSKKLGGGSTSHDCHYNTLNHSLPECPSPSEFSPPFTRSKYNLAPVDSLNGIYNLKPVTRRWTGNDEPYAFRNPYYIDNKPQQIQKIHGKKQVARTCQPSPIDVLTNASIQGHKTDCGIKVSLQLLGDMKPVLTSPNIPYYQQCH